MSHKSDYTDMIEKIGREEYKERFEQLQKSAEAFIEQSGFQDTVYCNIRLLAQVLLDYYADIERLKDFHDIKKVRSEKINAYSIAWIVKRKPLQYKVDSKEEKDIFVNERFAVYLLLNECVCGGNDNIDLNHVSDLTNYIDMLLYYFKYRECNPQVLELAITSFKMGTYVIKGETDSDSVPVIL